MTTAAMAMVRHLSPQVAAQMLAPWRERASCKGHAGLLDNPDREREAKDLCLSLPGDRAV